MIDIIIKMPLWYYYVVVDNIRVQSAQSNINIYRKTFDCIFSMYWCLPPIKKPEYVSEEKLYLEGNISTSFHLLATHSTNSIKFISAQLNLSLIWICCLVLTTWVIKFWFLCKNMICPSIFTQVTVVDITVNLLLYLGLYYYMSTTLFT